MAISVIMKKKREKMTPTRFVHTPFLVTTLEPAPHQTRLHCKSILRFILAFNAFTARTNSVPLTH